MRRILTLYVISLLAVASAMAQERHVENRPYCDLRPFHLGVIVGTHWQDAEFCNAGPITVQDVDGNDYESIVTCEQPQWENGFQVGVLGELRINDYIAFRTAPTLYFANRRFAFHNLVNGNELESIHSKEMRTVYMGCDLDVIYAAKRFNNHRPYMMAGLCPMLNLTSGNSDYFRFNKTDIFFEIGLGCDLYMPFFKLRPELKFMLGLTNCFDSEYAKKMKDANKLPFTRCVEKATSKVIALTFYFE